ncbi:hypothetical protein PVN32_26515, partial [Bacillus paralicheniformis]
IKLLKRLISNSATALDFHGRFKKEAEVDKQGKERRTSRCQQTNRFRSDNRRAPVRLPFLEKELLTKRIFYF